MALRWKWFQGMVEDFRAGEPGRRFLTLYEHRKLHRREHPVRAWLYIGFGFILLVVGVVLSLPPGVPGFFLWIPGMLMIATRLHWAAIVMDRFELLARRIAGRFRRKRRKPGGE